MVALGGHVWLLPGEVCMVAPGGVRGCSGGACVVAVGGSWGMHGCCQGVWLLPGGHVWDMTRYGDTINEQVVHILLECILVEFHEMKWLAYI